MMLDDTILAAISKCVSLNIPFALYSFPESRNFEFFANPSFPEGIAKSKREFFIVPWLNNFQERQIINDELSAEDVLDKASQKLSDAPEINEHTTSKSDYINKLRILIPELKNRQGKTVISRVFCGDATKIDLLKFVLLQFESFPSSFRYMFFTPISGLWVGTTPEILLNISFNTGNFEIMSLAGTRRASLNNKPWNCKNVTEQSMVATYISNILTDFKDISYSISRKQDLMFPPVCHICDIFAGKIPPDIFVDVINALNPTPAICGVPKEKAISEISYYENHLRKCYGGYIGVDDGCDNIKTFVNLRCINFSKSRFCAYAGGGITANSIPEEEWNETLHKTEILRKNISKSTLKTFL